MTKRLRRRRFSVSQLTLSSHQSSEIVSTIQKHFGRAGRHAIPTHLAQVLKKYKGQTNKESADSLAITKFLRTEDHCKKINHDFRCHRPFGHDEPILDRARTLVHRCLGYDFAVDELASSGRFGPGSSTNCRGLKATGEAKFRNSQVHPQAKVLTQMILQKYFPVWASYLTDSENASPLLDTCAAGRLTCVPKNSEVSRTIIIEPELNTFFQLGLGAMMRKRIRNFFNLDLNESDKLNRRLARVGSIYDDLATIDFSSASDCISVELCRWILPPAWFDAIFTFRTPDILLPSGERVRLEKISSMGNGFTWELESLIFHALAVATCEIEGYNDFWVSTFGDDVVIPSGCASEFMSACTRIGLLINYEKSYLTGPFRESCGRDWWKGFDIRPIYLREQDQYSLINFINQLQRSHHAEYQSLARKLIPYVLPELRVWGTSHVGCLYSPDAGLERDTRRGADVGSSTWDGTWSRIIRPVMETFRRRCDRFTLLYKTFNISSQDGENYATRTLSHYVEDLVFVPAQ